MKNKIFPKLVLLLYLFAILIFSACFIVNINYIKPYDLLTDENLSAICNEISEISDSNADSILNYASEFLLNTYINNGIFYNTFTHLDTIEMYCNDFVSAYYITFNRDNYIDYIVIENRTYRIKEFGYDTNINIGELSGNTKIEYLGNDEYYKVKGRNAEMLYASKNLDYETLNIYRADYANRILNILNTYVSSAVTDGSKGMIDSPNPPSAARLIAEKYLTGITKTGINSNMKFYDTSNLSSASTDNNCGPTAILNLFKYYHDLGYTSKTGNKPLPLMNGSVDYKTAYKKFVTLSKQDKVNGTRMGNIISAIKQYSKERGFKYNSYLYLIKAYGNIKKAINNNKIGVISMQVKLTNGDTWGHAVLAVGYQEYGAEGEKLRYVRTIDGWHSNSARYVDYDFYDTMDFFEFKLINN